MQQLAPAALSAWLSDPARARPQVLDVRESWEVQIARIEGSLHIPMGQVPARVAELDAGTDVVVVCHHGGRSMQVALFLEKQGFARVHNMVGGVDAWARSVDPAMPVY
jgi:rhodanese-related sulfurtransferase